jgi:hypothetical protein
MRVSTTALYTLAALIAGDLTQQAIAKPVSTATPERPEASDIESAAERSLPSSIDAVTPPEQLQAIAFAEAVLTQYSEEYTRELTGISAEEDTTVVVPAESSPTEIELAAIEVLATMPAPEIMGVEYRAYDLNSPAESFEVAPEAVPFAELLVEDEAVEDEAAPAEELAFDPANFSTYHEIAVAPPEAIAIPERMPESVPKVIEAIAIPEFFMPERSEQWFNDLEAPVNVLLPTTLSSEGTQTYALGDLEEDEDLWIQAMIESEFAEQAPTGDGVAADLAFEIVHV